MYLKTLDINLSTYWDCYRVISYETVSDRHTLYLPHSPPQSQPQPFSHPVSQPRNPALQYRPSTTIQAYPQLAVSNNRTEPREFDILHAAPSFSSTFYQHYLADLARIQRGKPQRDDHFHSDIRHRTRIVAKLLVREPRVPAVAYARYFCVLLPSRCGTIQCLFMNLKRSMPQRHESHTLQCADKEVL